MAQRIGDLPNGSLVKDIATTYNGAVVLWRKANHDHPGYPANSTTLITDRVIMLKPFDAREPGNANANRASNGNNRYRTSNLRQWLNSGGAANSWWAAQNLADGVANTNNRDAAPAAADVWSGHNHYAGEAGFLANFSASFRSALLDTTLAVARNTVTDGGGSEQVTDRIFLASNTEVGLANENGVVEGAAFPIFAGGNAGRQAIPTPQCVSQSSWQGSGFNSTQAWWWWLRSPSATVSHGARDVHASGALSNSSAFNGHIGVRPLCNLDSGILVSDSPDTDGAFTILWIQPPPMPASINVPATILGGSSAQVSWSAVTDPQSQAVQYRLERSVDGGAFALIFQGAALQHTDSVALGINTVQYRVRAVNASGLESANNTSPLRTVASNSPPAISGADGPLGQQSSAFIQAYTVTDPDAGDIITVTESLNGMLLRQFQATSGAAQQMTVTQDWFSRLGSGTHALTVTASDQFGASATRTWTFTRDPAQTSQIRVSLASPLAADDMPTRILVSVGRTIPQGATFQVEVCNNGNDPSPAWEDCTSSVLLGAVYAFASASKAHANWGVNVRVSVVRGGADGLCYISSIGGNFE